MIVVIIMYEILVIMDNIFHTFFVHEPMFVHLDLSDKYASWVYQPLQNSTYCVTYTWYHQITQELMSFWCQIRFSLSCHAIMYIVCHLSVYWRQLGTRDQFPSALRNIWQLVSNVLGRVVIGRGGRTVSSLQQELKTFVLENHES